MRVLLSIILSSLGALANLTFVLAIVVYIFAVIGMQLFGRDYTPENFYPDPVPRWNFKDFFHSFMMIFRILCGEWAEPLWDCMRAERNSVSFGYISLRIRDSCLVAMVAPVFHDFHLISFLVKK